MRKIVRALLIAGASLALACSNGDGGDDEAPAADVRIERVQHAILDDGQVAVAGLVRTDVPVRQVEIVVEVDGRRHLDTLPFCLPDAQCWWGTSLITRERAEDVDVRILRPGRRYDGDRQIGLLRAKRAGDEDVIITAPGDEGTVYVLAHRSDELTFAQFYFTRRTETPGTRLPIGPADRVRAYFYPGRVRSAGS